MDTQVVQILSVAGRISRSQKAMYDVAVSDGTKYTTFDGAMAQKAQQFQGQQVIVRYDVSVKGTNTYYNLVDVFPAGSAPPPATVAIPMGAPAPMAPAIPLAPYVPNNGDPNRDAKIQRQTAAKVAFEFIAGHYQGAGQEALGESVPLARALTDELVGFFASGLWPGQNPPEPQVAAIAASVPGVQAGVGEPVERPDIPWNA